MNPCQSWLRQRICINRGCTTRKTTSPEKVQFNLQTRGRKGRQADISLPASLEMLGYVKKVCSEVTTMEYPTQVHQGASHLQDAFDLEVFLVFFFFLFWPTVAASISRHLPMANIQCICLSSDSQSPLKTNWGEERGKVTALFRHVAYYYCLAVPRPSFRYISTFSGALCPSICRPFSAKLSVTTSSQICCRLR